MPVRSYNRAILITRGAARRGSSVYSNVNRYLLNCHSPLGIVAQEVGQVVELGRESRESADSAYASAAV